MLQLPVDMKEDCLIANVFVPDTAENNLSVLVYVHGGGFATGFGNLLTGTQFVREKKDVIMVTLNYRLGVHGFLCLGTEDVPGNAGLKDVVALLRWVQENIASFGGNPDNITLAGFSVGSAIVDLLTLSKLTEGLFQRVIPESAANIAALTVQRDPLEIARSFAKDHNVANVDDIKALEQFYKTASFDLLTAQAVDDRTDSTFLFSACVERKTDGAVLTETPLNIIKSGNYKKIPMLYGFTNMEGLIRATFFETWKDLMNAKFSDFLPVDLKFESDEEREEVAETVKKFYFGDNLVSNETILSYVDFFTDVMFAYPMLRAVQLQAEAGNNQVYLYEYSFVDEDVEPVNYTDVRGADHCAQSGAWLDNMLGTDESLATPEYQKMRKIVRDIWHSFIKTG